MSSAIAAAEARKKDPRKPFQEEDFTTIRRLLLQVGKPSWSERPRTYLVLRLIDEISAIEGFVLEGLKDIHFPYTEERLPKVISSVGKRHAFLEKQKLVMSNKIADLVRGGPHRHLSKPVSIRSVVIPYLHVGRQKRRYSFHGAPNAWKWWPWHCGSCEKQVVTTGIRST